MIDFQIDKHSVIPIYHQLQEAFVDLINSGYYKADDILPSENEIAKKFNISRNTAQRVLNNLVNRGLAYRIQGLGTFVANKKITYSIVTSLSYSAEIIGLNKNVRSKLIFANEINASELIAHNLIINVNEPVYSIQRLRYIDEIPMTLQTSFLPKALVPGLIEKQVEEESLFKIISKDYGLDIDSATETLQAVKVNNYEAKILELDTGEPAFLIERITKLKNGQVIEFVKTILRGDKSKFYIELPEKQS
ncbi:MAG TPA: GntR family transcriptional regulator [Candidatus Marinimicrobia bacterium]|jgi:GntR family transcriptional regulator|nr:GntR family transcriptional regulator [Candidatus Neomarinimicrobiota bacterium]HQM35326.1 GntR family transcriptional regulator [Candidatus Neomarinimicrobiota bacterium]